MSRLEDVQKLLEEAGHVSQPKRDIEEEEEPVATDEPTDDGETEEAVQEEETRYTVKELAAKLETTPAKLYAAMDVKLSDGTTMTLSELKDLAVKGKTIDTYSAQREKDYNELMVQRKEVTDVMQNLSNEGKLTEETINKVRELNNQRLASEMKLLLKALPEWESQSIREREVKQIGEYVRQYGLSNSEVDSLVTDHRLMKLIRDVATKPMNKPKDIAPSGRQSVAKPKADTTTTAGKLAAISALIN